MLICLASAFQYYTKYKLSLENDIWMKWFQKEILINLLSCISIFAEFLLILTVPIEKVVSTLSSHHRSLFCPSLPQHPIYGDDFELERRHIFSAPRIKFNNGSKTITSGTYWINESKSVNNFKVWMLWRCIWWKYIRVFAFINRLCSIGSIYSMLDISLNYFNWLNKNNIYTIILGFIFKTNFKCCLNRIT